VEPAEGFLCLWAKKEERGTANRASCAFTGVLEIDGCAGYSKKCPQLQGLCPTASAGRTWSHRFHELAVSCLVSIASAAVELHCGAQRDRERHSAQLSRRASRAAAGQISSTDVDLYRRGEKLALAIQKTKPAEAIG